MTDNLKLEALHQRVSSNRDSTTAKTSGKLIIPETPPPGSRTAISKIIS
jgi:hypothetical protein